MSFLNTLKPEEHRMLRQLVKDIHFQYFDEKHGRSFVSNSMLDNIIESQGREAIEKLLKSGIDKGLR